MKLSEKLTAEEVDEMILETDADDTQCSKQLADVSVPQIANIIVEVVTAFHRSESQNESLYRSSTCQNTHKVMEKIVKDSQSPAASYAQDAKSVSRQDPAANWRTSCEQARPASRRHIHEKINHVSKQKGNSIQNQHF